MDSAFPKPEKKKPGIVTLPRHFLSFIENHPLAKQKASQTISKPPLPSLPWLFPLQFSLFVEYKLLCFP